MYLKDSGEEMVLSDEENDDTRHSYRFFYSNAPINCMPHYPPYGKSGAYRRFDPWP